jgi:hypothetical protein
LGLDYGLRFDSPNGQQSIGNGTKLGQAAKFTFMLGFEPE